MMEGFKMIQGPIRRGKMKSKIRSASKISMSNEQFLQLINIAEKNDRRGRRVSRMPKKYEH